ncbi:Lecithine-cholesterol acyltransferase-like 4 [Hordeum vulgare]|nr:Lecithine-cholesterol acyltransferase-like 4 [Hordeum vulgare]
MGGGDVGELRHLLAQRQQHLPQDHLGPWVPPPAPALSVLVVDQRCFNHEHVGAGGHGPGGRAVAADRKEEVPLVDPSLDPVLLALGIGDSILEVMDEAGNKELVWVHILAIDHECREKLWAQFDGSTAGKTVCVDEKIRIIVPEERYGLYAIDILDPDLIIGDDSVYYYHDMIVQMIKWGYQEGKTLFGFGYDFRQSNSEMCATTG